MVALGWERMVRYQILSAGKHSLCDNGNDVPTSVSELRIFLHGELYSIQRRNML